MFEDIRGLADGDEGVLGNELGEFGDGGAVSDAVHEVSIEWEEWCCGYHRVEVAGVKVSVIIGIGFVEMAYDGHGQETEEAAS